MSKVPHSSHPAEPEASSKHEHDDDVIVVPKGSSRARFLLTALLTVLVLTTFTVSPQVVDFFTGGNRAASAFMSWKRPDGTVVHIPQTDFYIVKQDLSRAQAILSGGRATKDRDDLQTARHIIVDELAKEAGVQVTDEELRETILPRFGGSGETYRMILERYRTTAREFEQTLRSLLRVDRFQSLLTAAAMVPDPATVLDRWKKSHKEYSFEVVEVDTEPFTEEVTAASPAGEELKKWFDALPEAQKSGYRAPIEAKTAADFAYFLLDPMTSSERLLAKYPRPEGENPEEVAKTWYEVNKTRLFKKPDLPLGQPPSPDDYLPFEEVQEKARAQGVANQSILDWLNDMKAREAKGEAIDFAIETTNLGLGYRKEQLPHTHTEWRTIGMQWSGRDAVEAMFAPTAEAGKLLPDVIVDPKGLFVGFLTEKQASRVPEFPEIEATVKKGWISKRKEEIALQKLEALYAKLPTQPNPDDPATPLAVETDASKFQAAAQELGLEIKPQDWIDAGATIKPAEATPARLFLRQVSGKIGSVVGAISKPELAADKSKAWLARNAGSRDPDPQTLTPLEYQTAGQYAMFEARQAFFEETFGSADYLKRQYGLELESWRREAAAKGSSPEPQ